MFIFLIKTSVLLRVMKYKNEMMQNVRGGVHLLGVVTPLRKSFFLVLSFFLLFTSNIIFSSCQMPSSSLASQGEEEEGCDIYTQRCPRSGGWSSGSSRSGRSSRRSSSTPEEPPPPLPDLSPPEVEEARQYICGEYDRMFEEIRDGVEVDEDGSGSDRGLTECIEFEGRTILCPDIEYVRGCLRVQEIDDPSTPAEESDNFDMVCINDEASLYLNERDSEDLKDLIEEGILPTGSGWLATIDEDYFTCESDTYSSPEMSDIIDLRTLLKRLESAINRSNTLKRDLEDLVESIDESSRLEGKIRSFRVEKCGIEDDIERENTNLDNKETLLEEKGEDLISAVSREDEDEADQIKEKADELAERRNQLSEIGSLITCQKSRSFNQIKTLYNAARVCRTDSGDIITRIIREIDEGFDDASDVLTRRGNDDQCDVDNEIWSEIGSLPLGVSRYERKVDALKTAFTTINTKIEEAKNYIRDDLDCNDEPSDSEPTSCSPLPTGADGLYCKLREIFDTVDDLDDKAEDVVSPLRNDVDSLEENIDDLIEELSGDSSVVRNLKTEIQRIMDDIEDIEEEIAGKEEQLSDREGKISEKRAEIVENDLEMMEFFGEVRPRISAISSERISTRDRDALMDRLLKRQKRDLIRKLIMCVYYEQEDCLEPAEESALEQSEIIHVGEFRNFVKRRFMDKYATRLECENSFETGSVCRDYTTKPQSDRLSERELEEDIEGFEAEFTVGFQKLNEWFEDVPYSWACPLD